MEGQTLKTGTFGSSLANPNPQPASISQAKTPEAPKQTYEQILKEEDGLDKDFLEERYIVIALATDITINSVYRQVNARYIAERHDSIGGSINSARVLTSNYEEMAAYMPSLIGCSSNAQEYVTRVQRWFNSISIPVDGDGKKLNCSFQWRKKRDYLDYKIDETAIVEEYDNAEKSNPKQLKDAIARYVNKINALESTRYKYGHPIKVDDYLAYRHCLLYPIVAKDVSVISFDSRIKFYIKDEQREANRLKRSRIQANKARRNYLDAIDNDAKFKAIFVCYCASNKQDVLSNLLLDRTIQEKILDEFAIKEPEKFNKLFNNSQVELQAFIEEAIARGELVRSEVNQTVLTPEGGFIGANMKEALAYFSNPENADYKRALETKLKL